MWDHIARELGCHGGEKQVTQASQSSGVIEARRASKNDFNFVLLIVNNKAIPIPFNYTPI